MIEHSLKGVGGHHYEYAIHVLDAARQAGLPIVLATHRDFEAPKDFPAEYRVFNLFPVDTYSRHCDYFRTVYSGDRPWWKRLPGIAWRTFISPVQSLNHQRGAKEHRARFAEACRELFEQAPPNPEDIILIPTISELDLAGLVDFFESNPESQKLDWRLQFHFDLYEGRPPEYARQATRAARLKSKFSSALKRAPKHRLSLYNTTEQIAEQYNSLECGEFESLPYPVNPNVRPSEGAAGSPLRITCAGYIRREKGRHHLSGVINGIWDELLKSGDAKLVVQGKRKQIQSVVRKSKIPPAKHETCVETPEHPLSGEAYAELIATADIGLFLYDGRRYFGRCSGVLVEMLASGAPVITPAGCWLAEQFQKEEYEYLAELLKPTDVITSETLEAELAFGHEPVEQVVAIPENAETNSILAFTWPREAEFGDYVRVHCRQLNSKGEVVEDTSVVLGAAEELRAKTMLRLNPEAKRLKIAFSNAYGERRLVTMNPQLTFLRGESQPLGRLGLTFDRTEDIPRLLIDMCKNHAHYREGAGAFSATWRERHSPMRTIERILGRRQNRRPIKVA